MKKQILNLSLGLSIFSVFSFTTLSCRSREDEGTENVTTAIDPNNFKGEIKAGSTVTLDPAKIYKLTGKLLVENGATLIIPAGTRIVAEQGANYLIVDRGGKLYVNGTASAPVIFEGKQHGQGYWGGIVILGYAPTNRSASGTSTSELGDLIYGGSNSQDNSGVLNYLIIKDSGFKYNPEKEFNGLSLFGVGSETQISNIYVVDGADDGIECFGGSPNLKNIVIIGVGDDSFDWTEGYNGTVENLYAARKKVYQSAAEPGNRGIEADTQDTNPETTNGNGESNPTLKNITLIGNSEGPESQALKIRAGSKGRMDNLVLANYNVGLDFETDRTYNWFTSGSRITNVKMVNINTVWKAKPTTNYPNPDLSSVFSINNSATGAGSGTSLPDWAKGWTGLTSFDISDASN